MSVEDYKKEYITNQFRKSFGKKYENYCISRIYHLLNRADVQIVSQQVLYRGKKKRAMADLYFPQINVWIEINEGHHLSQKEDDERRTQEAISNKIKHLEEVVSITTLDKPEIIEIPNKSLEQINDRIDEIVDLIKRKINELEESGMYVPWNGANEDPYYFIDKGSIDILENAQFRTSQLVSELFNKHYKKGSQKNYFRTNIPNTAVWCPKLSLDDGDFDHIQYQNTIRADGKTIIEIDKNDNEQFYKDAINNPLGAEKRFVFPYYKCSDGRFAYKFRGVYQLDIEKTKSKKARTWVWIDGKLDLSQFFKC